MSLVVLKFGGSFIGDIKSAKGQARFQCVANLIKHEKEQGHQVIVVISAFAQETRRLRKMSLSVAPEGSVVEDDVILSAGEQVSAGLLAKFLTSASINLKARSLLAWQIPIVTDANHGNADILSIDASKIKKLLDDDYVLVIPGFQGITQGGDMTTLGFEGSDTSAVALAAALEASHCYFYKDVAGVYSANPKLVPLARKIPKISYKDMWVLSSLGANILHPKAVKMAHKHAIRLHILSDLLVDPDVKGTVVCDDLFDNHVVGITYFQQENEAVHVSLVSHVLREADKHKIIDALKQKKIIAELVETEFTDSSITVKINWLDQLNTALMVLHALYNE